jgi:hypothetical protein
MRTNDAQHIASADRECFWGAGFCSSVAFKIRSEDHLAAVVAHLSNHVGRYVIIGSAVAAEEYGHISISSQRHLKGASHSVNESLGVNPEKSTYVSSSCSAPVPRWV